jgi:hypothetical protein
MRRVPDIGAVDIGYGFPIAIGEVHIIRTDRVMILETVYLTAFVFEQIFHSIVFVVLSPFRGDGMLNGACHGQ